MEILRTPDTCFSNLSDFPFEPHYTQIKTHDGSDLRAHHIDEGAKGAPLVLCMHGQPVWSYLYRKMIPFLNADGLRVICPDLVGYGKSDKPASRDDYSYERQVDWMGQWLEKNDLSGITFFWSGLGRADWLALGGESPPPLRPGRHFKYRPALQPQLARESGPGDRGIPKQRAHPWAT